MTTWVMITDTGLEGTASGSKTKIIVPGIPRYNGHGIQVGACAREGGVNSEFRKIMDPDSF